MSSKEETGLQRRILDAVNASGAAFVWRQQSGRVRARRGMLHLAPKGSSDVVGYMLDCSGRHVAIEVKLPKEKPTAEQQQALDRALAANVVAGVVRSVDEAVELVLRASRAAA